MTEKTDNDTSKTEDGFSEPRRQRVGTSFFVPLMIILDNAQANSRFNVEVQVTARVLELKLDFQRILNLAAENQSWSFKNIQLNDTDTIQMSGIKKHDIILCQNAQKRRDDQGARRQM